MESSDATRQISEQERQAASIHVSISSYVATATLGALAGAIALFTYLSQAYDLPSEFYWALGAAGVAFVVSLVIGAKGSAEVAKLLASGTWTSKSKVPKFTGQALLALTGLILLLAATAVALGSPRHESSLELRIQHLETGLAQVEQEPSATGETPTKTKQNQSKQTTTKR